MKTVRRREFSVIEFRRAVPGKTGGQRTGLHGQDRDRLEANDVEHDPPDAGSEISPKGKLSKPLKKPKAMWVEPILTTKIECRDITSEGLRRANSFKVIAIVT